MSMADKNTSRSYRSNDPFRRNQPTDEESAGDPLAELARLIGQADPFADYGRQNARDAESREAPPASEWRRTTPAMPPYEPAPEEAMRAPETVRQAAPRSEPRFADEPFPRRDPYQMSAEGLADPRDAEGPGRYQQEPPFAEERGYQREEPQFGEERGYHREEEPLFADDHFRQAGQIYPAPTPDSRLQSPYFDDGTPMDLHEEDFDDAPRTRKRGGFVTAMVLIVCAIVGTAGAYGYRTYYVVPNANRAPPVITAETTPSKVLSADMQAGKIAQDRVADPGQNERLVSREEQPVVIRPPFSASSSQSAFPPPLPPNVASSGVGGTSQPSTGGGNDPKRVRTVTIRPDGADASNRPTGSFPPAVGMPPGMARPAPQSKAPPSRSTGPMSLEPRENAFAEPAPAPVPAPAPREPRIAAVSPPAPRAPTVPSEGATGGYVVQITSQRSEAEAQASFRTLRAKFPDQLASYSPIVKRVDLGAKGIFYRALVGPFASSGEADQFCSNLKAAGGGCISYRN